MASALAGALKKAGPTRQWLYLQLAHEVCMLDIDDPKKWDRLADLRTTLGEMVVIPAVSALRGDGRVANLVEQWDNRNVFGGPTLLNQIRKAITDSPATVSSSAKSSSEATEVASTVQGEEKKKPKAEAVQDTRKPQAEAPAPAESNAMAAEGTTAQTVKKEYAEANKTDKPAKTETPAKPNEEQVLPLKQEEKPVDLSSESNVATKSPSPTKLQQVKFDFEKEVRNIFCVCSDHVVVDLEKFIGNSVSNLAFLCILFCREFHTERWMRASFKYLARQLQRCKSRERFEMTRPCSFHLFYLPCQKM